jgi:hypothetical protein
VNSSRLALKAHQRAEKGLIRALNKKLPNLAHQNHTKAGAM